MFLSKKWILSIIAVTGILFLILLIIQFGWISKSMEISRRRITDKMVVVSNSIRQAFMMDKALQKKYLNGTCTLYDMYTGDINGQKLDGIVKKKLDSVLAAENLPLSTELAGRIDTFCYHMSNVPAAWRSAALDHSTYKICLCSNNYKGSLDIGFNLFSENILIKDSSGLILPSVILILLLITLFVYIIYIMNRQKKQAELKNDFINNLTHEFNTPLFSIGLTSNLLLRSDPIHQSDKLKGYVELISTEKNRLQEQVDKILRLTAVESGSGIMETEKVDMRRVIEQSMAGFSIVLAEKKGNITLQSDAAAYYVKGDRVHLFNAISNLIDNAIKYSVNVPEIVISVAQSGSDLFIRVQDNGIGLHKDDMELIFDKFYRVKQGDRHDVKGFGIGLSYVKKIIELHGGSIDVQSRPGEGSLFVVRLPVHP